jgi:D-serine deaminase-like pyridoxal phosphate-dependent protein
MVNVPEIGARIEEVETPALLVDLDKLEKNLRTMADYIKTVRAELRPHAKTHKTPEVAQRQIAAGALGITCAKLGEAEVMADAGIQDLLIANEIVGRQKITRLMELARRADVMVAVDDANNVRDLSEAAQATGVTVRVLVEVNIGMNRCGVEPGEPALRLAQAVDKAQNLEFMGLMGYEGHCVAEKDFEKRRAAALEAVGRLVESKRVVEAGGLPVAIVSGGGTGTYNMTGAHPDMTEVQAGSYVFMDADYRRVTPEFENALTVLTAIVSRQPGRLVLDVGRKGVGDDHGPPFVRDYPEVKFLRTSEEHSRCAFEGDTPLKPGDKLYLVVGHCCTTCNLHDRMYAYRDGRIEEIWEIKGRGRFD